MRLSLTLIVVFLLVGVTACNENPAPTQATVAMENDGPPATSAIVFRDGIPSMVTWVDFESGLRVVAGADMDEFCAASRTSRNPSCRSSTCPPIAAGQPKTIYTDIDIFVSGEHTTSTWTWMAHGKLVGADGRPAPLNAVFRVADGNNSGIDVFAGISLRVLRINRGFR